MEVEERIVRIRHSFSHLLAVAMKELVPGVQLGIGPVIENGFYYDFRIPAGVSFGEEMLPDVEEKMRDIALRKLPFSKRTLSAKELRTLFANEPFKLELIDEYEREGQELTVYDTGDVFTDLCKGEHIGNTSELPLDGFKLMRVSGAYWRGDEKNAMLTRIYGVAFGSKEELDAHLHMLAEAEQRDHRRLGRELDLFTFSELVGSGLPLYTPRGALVRRLLTGYIEELQSKAGYTQVWTPQIAKAELFKTSGHYDKYKGDMFRVISNYSDEEFYLKPMNCPQHTQLYASRMRSYRDLPLRYTDFAMLYRDEKPGELSGLARVRSFSQDDCHVFCREDQVDEEIDMMLSMTKKVMETFGLTYRYRLSTRDPKRPEKYIGSSETWDKVEQWAERIMKRNNIEYFDGPGEAAFYAPKMDLMATDALGREHQLSTVQIDFFMPERFGLTYTDERGEKRRPVMLHRAIVGSPERFMMILLEHLNGALPAWLSPVQAVVLPISEKQMAYAEQVRDALSERGVRVELPEPDETLGNRIRKAELEKIPYLIVVGDKESAAKTINVRSRDDGSQREMTTEEFAKLW